MFPNLHQNYLFNLLHSAILAAVFKPENIENDFFTRLGFSSDAAQLAPGKVLISEPFLMDPNFKRTVVLIVNYTPEEGAFGLILNRASTVPLAEAVRAFPKSGFQLFFGGPVEEEAMFYIHQCDQEIEGAQLIKDNLRWDGDFEEILRLIDSGVLHPGNIKFFSGYSGWTAGQLEAELDQRSWIIGDLGATQILEFESELLWKSSLSSLGKKYSIMAGFPENPLLN